MYIIFKRDGSVADSYMSDYVMQGSTGVNVVHFAFEDSYRSGLSSYLACLLPNATNITVPGVAKSFDYNGKAYLGWEATIDTAFTTYPGTVFCSAVIIDSGSDILVNYPFQVTVNPTGYPLNQNWDNQITVAQYNSYMAQLNGKTMLLRVGSYATLPPKGSPSVIYLVPAAPNPLVPTNDAYDAYVWDSAINPSGAYRNIGDSVSKQLEIDQLNIDLSDEATARQNADSTLQDHIDAEALTRSNADQNLALSISGEATDRSDADDALQNNIDAVNADISANYQKKAEKNQINGYAGLDANAKIPSALIPDSILGQLEYKGVFTPTAYPLNPEKGWFYIASSNGTIGGVDYKTGDWAVYNGASWDKVDNTDAVASVNGKIGVVVINGTEITVGNGDAYTIQARIVAMMADIDNRYTKAQTYSNAQIEQRISDLMALTNIKDTAIQFSAGVYDLAYNGSVASTFPISLVSDCNIVIVRVLVGGQAEYSMFRPAMTSEGVGMNMPLTQKLDYAQIKRVGTNGEFALRVKANDALSTNAATMRMWGIKLSGFNATEVIYDHTASGIDAATVQEAIDVFYTLPHLTIDAEGYICVNYGSGRDITID